MSAFSMVTIFCDHPGCGWWSDLGVADTAKKARQSLGGSGWKLNQADPEGHGRRLDYCPIHAEEHR